MPRILILLSTLSIFILGVIHFIYTFNSNKFNPRDSLLAEQMRKVSPILSSETTMWKAWIGFNASHSLGAIFFGVLYTYLVGFEPTILFGSRFLAFLGFLFLAGLLILAKLYWFKIPLIGIGLSLILYIAGFVMSMA